MPRSRPRRHKKTPPPLPFSWRLMLRQWLLDLFGVERFDRLAGRLRDESLEGLDADNVHRFHRIVLQEEDRDSYIGAILHGIGGERAARSRR